MATALNITGRVFGKLTAIAKVGTKCNRPLWVLSCECGGARLELVGNLTSGKVVNCGCETRRSYKTIHGHNRKTVARSRTYQSWSSMMQRCCNENNDRYPSYGGRGITVCERWKDFNNFLADMGERPPQKSLDRIDNDKGYRLDNCKWSTRIEQQRNKRRSRKITSNGETKSIHEWAVITGISVGTIAARLSRGWPSKNLLIPPKFSRSIHHEQNRPM
jgi:hypothetical protein